MDTKELTANGRNAQKTAWTAMYFKFASLQTDASRVDSMTARTSRSFGGRVKLARFRGRFEIGDQAAVSMYRRSNSIGEMQPIAV